MSLVADLLAYLTLTVCIALLILAVTGSLAFILRRDKLALIGREHHTDRDSPDQVRISLLVPGNQSVNQVSRRLSGDYPCIELVIATDLEHDPAGHEIIEHYAMMQVDYVPTGEIPCPGIRAVYRSRQRRYRRLVLVDSMSGTPGTPLNCALALASYDWILPLAPETFLRPGALPLLVLELHEYDPQRIAALTGIRSPFSDPNLVQRLDQDLSLTMAAATGRQGSPPTGLFHRETTVELGGFAQTADPVTDLLERIRLVRRRDNHFLIRFIPRILADDEKIGRAVTPSGPGYHLARWATILSLSAAITVGLIALITGRPEIVYRILLCTVTLYLTFCTAALIGLLTAETSPTEGGKVIVRSLFSIFLYPFYLLERIVRGDRFPES